MPERSFSSLVPEVNQYVTGAPHATIEQHIKNAVRKVCVSSHVWRTELVKVDLVAGDYIYKYDVPNTVEVCAMLGAAVNNTPLQNVTLQDAIRMYPEWADTFSGLNSQAWTNTPSTALNNNVFNQPEFNDAPDIVLPSGVTQTAGGTPAVITEYTPQSFVLLPAPDSQKTYSLRMFVALRPSLRATGMDEYILDHIKEAVIDWALYSMYLIPERPWSDRNNAVFHGRQATFKTNQHRVNAQNTLGRAATSVRMRPFA